MRFSFFRRAADKKTGPSFAPVFLTNTLSGNKETFVPIKSGQVLMYSCGPTVYGPAHIGNLRSYVFSDTLVRTLQGAGYRVRRVINITDFGHLVSDGDEGEDKMTKGLKREGLALSLENMRSMAERYTAVFLHDLELLNLDTSSVDFPRASDYVKEQVAFIKTLEQKGYAYQTPSGVYFDTARFANYGRLGEQYLRAPSEHARVETKDKRHAADFVLWKPDAHLGWPSPWGQGFPGWHIECSTMSRSLLGPEIDIHTGGEDHIAVHHNNEIAQSEAASGRTFVHYWLHNAFLTMNGEKSAKSLGNVVHLEDVAARGVHPLALRYFFLQGHYRTPLSFSWDALAAAQNALERLWKLSLEIRRESEGEGAPGESRARFLAAMRDDLATPQALSVIWESLRDEDISFEEKWGLLNDADAHLGLSLINPPIETSLTEIPTDVQELLSRREAAREAREFTESDRLRAEIQNRGYLVEDSPEGPMLTKRPL